MDILERLLSDLCASLDDSDVVEPKAIVDNIETVVFSETVEDNEFDHEYVTDLLFRSETPPNLFIFLNQCVRSKERSIVQAKVALLKFIGNFVNYSGYRINSVSSLLFTACYDLYCREESREFKATCLFPIRKLLAIATSSKIDKLFSLDLESLTGNLRLGSLFDHLMEEFRASKQSKGGRCEILKVLGLLVRVFPDHPSIFENIEKLSALCQKQLDLNMSAGTAGSGKEPDLPTIAGCFSCVDRCMYDFEDRFRNPAQLWAQLLMAVSSVLSGDMNRYAVVGKALRLIKNHAGMFRSVLGGNLQKTYDVVQVGAAQLTLPALCARAAIAPLPYLMLSIYMSV